MAVTKKRATRGGRLLRRVAWAAGTLAVLYFAVEGGEYGTTDLYELRERTADLDAELALLRDTVAALDSVLKQVSSDDFTLERIAREEHGLVKGEKELLYWVDDPASRTGVSPDSAKKPGTEDTAGLDSSL